MAFSFYNIYKKTSKEFIIIGSDIDKISKLSSEITKSPIVGIFVDDRDTNWEIGKIGKIYTKTKSFL